MKTKLIEIYEFDELSDSAKQAVIDNLRDINTDYEWWDCTLDDAKEIGAILGIDIDNIYFSGFCSQGDGAQFVGTYSYAKGASKTIREYAPLDTKLHEISDNLQDIQRRNFYSLDATVTSFGNYSHEMATQITVDDSRDFVYPDKNTEDGVAEYLRDFMCWIYSGLEKEYEYLTSDEAIIESIKCNGYEFDVNGCLI